MDGGRAVRNLVEQIESYLKQLLAQSPGGQIEIQRSDLAQLFACVPSQINYVLGTRFLQEQGYLVESRRGGGGYVRIVKLPLDQEREIKKLIDLTAGKLVSFQMGEGLIERLREEGFLSSRESILMRAVIQNEALPMETARQRELVRSALLRTMLLTLLREDFV